MFSNFIVRYNTCKSRQWKFLNPVLQLESIEEYYISSWIINLPIYDIDEFFFLNIFCRFYQTFQLQASILPIISKAKKKNPKTIRSSTDPPLSPPNPVCTCKSETMRGVQSHDTGGTRLSFQSDTCLRDRCLSALDPVTSSSRPCFPIDTPPVIMVALYKPHDTVQPLSSSDKQAHPCRGRASSLRHLSNLFHGTRSFKKKKKHGV